MPEDTEAVHIRAGRVGGKVSLLTVWAGRRIGSATNERKAVLKNKL
jgi:hypothetical protein